MADGRPITDAGRIGPAASGARERPPRSVALDALRIVAALWVVLFHWSKAYWWTWMPPLATDVARAGYLGVDLFFVLSGAVISFTALGRTWGQFARARFLRLFPAYVLVVLLTVLLSAYLGGWEPRLQDFVSFTGIQLWSGAGTFVAVSWTLFYEVIFYVLVTAVIAVRRRADVDALRMGVAVLLAANLVALSTQNKVLMLVTLGPYAGHFATGVLLGISRTTRDLRRNLPALVVAVALVFQTLAQRTTELEKPVAVQGAIVLATLGTAVGFVLWSTLRAPRPVRFPRVRRVVTTAALMTYPLYLIHQQFGLALAGRLAAAGWPRRAFLPVALLALVAVCWLSVRVLEPRARHFLARAFLWPDEGRAVGRGDRPGPTRIDATPLPEPLPCDVTADDERSGVASTARGG